MESNKSLPSTLLKQDLETSWRRHYRCPPHPDWSWCFPHDYFPHQVYSFSPGCPNWAWCCRHYFPNGPSTPSRWSGRSTWWGRGHGESSRPMTHCTGLCKKVPTLLMNFSSLLWPTVFDAQPISPNRTLLTDLSRNFFARPCTQRQQRVLGALPTLHLYPRLDLLPRVELQQSNILPNR